MKVLFLGSPTSPLVRILKDAGEEVKTFSGRTLGHEVDNYKAEFLVSYGYPYIIKKAVLDRYPNKVINLHPSYLPWNRGYEPEFWSFVENTPKGVSIHYVDEGVDTGDLIVQKEVGFMDDQTFGQHYGMLQKEMLELFKSNWESIRSGNCPRIKQSGGGSFHRAVDKENYVALLPEGDKTLLKVLMAGAAKLQVKN